MRATRSGMTGSGSSVTCAGSRVSATREAQLLERLRRSWQAEREWSRELRDQIQRMQATHGTLVEGGERDVAP